MPWRSTDRPEAALFELLSAYPFSAITSTVVIALAAIFFVAGADAGAIVLGTFSSRGSLHPGRWLIAGWGTLIGATAIVLLLVGGLEALQWAAIVAASPFVLILVGMCIALWRELLIDPEVRGEPIRMERGAAPSPAGLSEVPRGSNRTHQFTLIVPMLPRSRIYA